MFTLRDFVHKSNYYHSIIHDVELNNATIEAIIKDIKR